MRKKARFTLIIFLLLIVTNIYAQDVLRKWGKVSSISASSISIETEDLEDKGNTSFTCSIPGKIELEGVADVKELNKGDFIIIEYTLDKKKRADAQKITASGRLMNQLRQSRTQMNVSEEIKKLWAEIDRIKQRLDQK